ncbi:beta-glucosidase M [Penicillium bovifimosum]|uniref:Probable beta-glucosidase M n=1 Tax=Penicillium bovifimosum TaxID=126998 RepID=A0A9W9GSL6_9EURO|nr:beta-glucosidase M [Penicillium bovifimosum]KAJ5129345.1 beta-glucosidase M [Penicillium bovifimosum]
MRSFAGLTALVAGLAFSSATAQEITSDVYFYGDSPPVYPTPQGDGAGDWAAAYKKAEKLVGQLTDEEKVSLTAGVQSKTGCSGFVPAIPRVNFPGLCVSDAGNGLRGTDFVSSYPSGIHAGASWNRDLTYTRGLEMGKEFYKKGVNVLLGPVVGPAGRVVQGGRNWEGISTDPYLSGALVYETVQGTQDAGVGVCTKHYIANEQETNRNPSGNVASVSSNIDDQTIHELYLWPFAEAVRAGSVSIMCSYNRLNNSYACQNSKALNGLLKSELGFQGYVMTDWGAQHAGIAAANAGLDMVMPNTQTWGSNLTTAISNGTMEASRLDDMATRIIASWYQVKQDSKFPAPGVGMPASLTDPHEPVIGRAKSSRDVLLQGAIEGHVLVKNNNGLPLRSPQLLSVFGYDAKAAAASSGSLFGSGNAAIQNSTLFVGGGSGSNSPSYMISPLAALQQEAYKDGTSIAYDVTSQNPQVNPASDACLVFINAFATEGSDRPGLSDTPSDTLVTNVASKCKNTVVVIHNAGVRLVNAWIDNANVTAVIYGHLPGQDSGAAIVELLYGRSNPSGRLPYTVAKKAEDYGALLKPDLPEGEFALFPQSNFTEGVYIDYRAFDKEGIEPQFEFGFGLSYTTFDYSGLQINKKGAAPPATPPAAKVQPGGNPHLWDEIVSVSATVKNSGEVEGDEVAQLYVGIPNGPIRQLRGFEKVKIGKGQAKKVAFSLTRKDLSTWSVEEQEWVLQRGDYQIFVGKSSRDLPLHGSFSL